jgi:PAS domain S-box-containing protein
MKKPSKTSQQQQEIRQKLIGLGEKSLRKSYYPELQVRVAELERFRALLDQSNDAILLIDADGLELVDANEAAANLLSSSKDQLAKSNLNQLIEFDQTLSFQGLLEGTGIENGQKLEGTCYFKAGDFKRHPIEFTAKVVAFADKKYLVFVGRDISERLKTEKEKDELQSQLMQAQKMEAIGTLAGGIAHDFNNILAAVLGYAELALEAARDSRTTPRELEQIIKSAYRAQELIKQILAFSRKVGPELKPLNLNKVISDTVPLIEHTIPKMISVELHLDEDLHLINGDANQIEQILLNLTVNASEAMPGEGRLVIETGNVTLQKKYANAHLDTAPGDYVLLSVSDTGEGMDKNTLEHIFEPFFTTKEVGKGTGLGLASTFGIVKSHGGHITCFSEPGQGTVFKIYIPSLEAADQLAGTSREDGDAVKGGNETILLVDDEEALRETGSRILSTMGYQALTASNGEEALATYRSRQGEIDLVVLDIGMPGMGGHRCLQEILAISPNAKVIIASGYSPGLQLKETLAAGAIGYIAKPFGKDDLLKKVRSVLDG